MENASKALFIAGGMLLMILILSFSVFVFKKFGFQTAEFYKDMDDTQIYEFNQKFFNYKTYDNNTIGIHDVISIINLAKDANDRELVPQIIEVILDGTKVNLTSIDTEGKLSSDLANKKRYTCDVKYGTNSNFVGKIEITTKH